MSSKGWFISSVSTTELIPEHDKVLLNNDLSDGNRNEVESVKNRLPENNNDMLFVDKMI